MKFSTACLILFILTIGYTLLALAGFIAEQEPSLLLNSITGGICIIVFYLNYSVAKDRGD